MAHTVAEVVKRDVRRRDRLMIPLTREPVIGCLPAAFDDMRAEASADGHRYVERLHYDWRAN